MRKEFGNIHAKLKLISLTGRQAGAHQRDAAGGRPDQPARILLKKRQREISRADPSRAEVPFPKQGEKRFANLKTRLLPPRSGRQAAPDGMFAQDNSLLMAQIKFYKDSWACLKGKLFPKQKEDE